MRFIAEGPDLPDDLLDARDEGQVMFFCGAGVSRAEAGGPSFRELADRVVTSLGSSRHSPARQLLELSEKIVPIPGVGGIPPADRVFAMLEQEFPVADVRRAVAAALRPTPNAGLGPHASLVDLSRGPDGVVRLVTTNFDRLFEQVDPTLAAIAPPELPDPARAGALRGIIHLHGKVSHDYTVQEGPEFVLSSADFGRAYLADGWATTFMRALMIRYRIVFVGYSADDPPIQYLLEALQPSIAPGQLYALQEGEASYATGLWRHKGVTAIAFNGFGSLWETLAAWAERARDPDGWRKRIAGMALRGPRDLQPHERGQVAHLVSSPIGATIFAEHDPAPPAEWLCAFDPYVRFDRRRSKSWHDPEPDRFDPFVSYGLDGETPPSCEEEDQRPGQTAVPVESWSAFEAAPGERPGGRNQLRRSLRGPGAITPAPLPARLSRLAWWIGKVAADPIAIWWASGQNALHSDIRFPVRQSLNKDGVAPDIRAAWRLIFAALDEPGEDARERYELEQLIGVDGWSRLSVIQLVDVERPRLTVRRPMTAPIAGRTDALHLVEADVSYAGQSSDLEVPDEHLLDYIDGTRRNLVLATRLEQMVGGFALTHLDPLNPFERGPNEFTASSPDISSLMAHLRNLVQRLHRISPDLAVAEAASWRSELGAPFRNLRLWAASTPGLTSPEAAAAIILSLDEDAWESRLERDLLTAIGARWVELPEEAKQRIEAMILAGPQPWEGVDPERFEPYRVDGIMRRLFWMKRSELVPSFDLDAEIARLKDQNPDWDAQIAAEQLDRRPSRGGWVGTDKSHSALLGASLDALLPEAQAASGRGRDFLMESRPFRGLVETRPVKALAALRRAAAKGEEWAWAWNDFLWSEARGNDSPRFRCYLARRIGALPEPVLVANLRALVQWFTGHAKPVWSADRELYLATWTLFAGTIANHPAAANSAIVVQGRHDWISEALNAPAGRLADHLFDELGWEDGTEGLTESLRHRAQMLLALPPEPQAHAAAQLAMRTNWFYLHDPKWTVQHLVPLIEQGTATDARDAAIAGFLRQSHFPPNELFLRLKPVMLALFADQQSTARRHDNLQSLILASWFRKDAEGNRLLASDDLREALITTSEPNRLGILRLIANWAEGDEDCATQTVEFLHWVWPRQLAVRSPAASTALAEIALRAGDRMPETTAAVLSVLETTAEQINAMPYVRRTKDDQISKFPEEHLALFFAILPEDTTLWPWGMGQVIERLSEFPALKNDPRLSDLRRRLARI
ncbi:MAG TPA: SIR2 family protein [Sphingomonas sp.]|nr:SIR2 family protein [Sphingomonas sp.]